ITRPVDEVLASVPASARLAEQYRDRFHKVRRGETLAKIASRYGVRDTELAAANNLDASSHRRLRVGQVLLLPERGPGSPVVVAARGVETRDEEVSDTGVAAAKPASGASESYRVRRGDTLASIAKRHGTTEADLARINSLRNRHKISVGQRLRVPAVEPVEVASAESAVPDVPAAKPVAPGAPGGPRKPRAAPGAPPRARARRSRGASPAPAAGRRAGRRADPGAHDHLFARARTGSASRTRARARAARRRRARHGSDGSGHRGARRGGERGGFAPGSVGLLRARRSPHAGARRDARAFRPLARPPP